MPIVPTKDIEALNFYEIHGQIWQTNTVALGIPAPLSTAIKANAVAARTAYTAQQNAIAAARTATLTWQSTMDILRSSGSNGLAAIKATADAAVNPDTVYALAQIPAPSTGTPLPPPGTPVQFSCNILSSGALNLKWKMTVLQPGNTFYQVRRKLAGETAFTLIGGSGNRSFTDETLPVGTDSVSYIVTANRGNISGIASNAFTVQFGVGGNFVTSNASNEGNSVKLAA